MSVPILAKAQPALRFLIGRIDNFHGGGLWQINVSNEFMPIEECYFAYLVSADAIIATINLPNRCQD